LSETQPAAKPLITHDASGKVDAISYGTRQTPIR
jgi:hypothetical protein